MTKGKLYLVPVPIGNSKDITFRAVEVLARVDLILAEDTRTSKILLAQYDISTPLLSYHQHNEKSRIDLIMSYLSEGQNLALISDAGMPLISDPGYLIVAELLKQQFPVIALPGANAGLTALIASGLETRRFSFIGFIAKNGSARKDDLVKLAQISDTMILYEAPHRLLKTLADLQENFAERKIAVGRELTKKYECYFYGTIEEALTHYQREEPRGEFVLILEGKAAFSERNPDFISASRAEQNSLIRTDLEELIAGGMKLKAASAFLSKKYSLPKNEIYQIGLTFFQG